MTRLSLTFRLIPHCCPQKQQCVGTILSGSASVSKRGASIRLRCGPQTSDRTSCSLGNVAISADPQWCVFAGTRVAAPDLALCDGQHRAPAGGADALIVLDAGRAGLVVVAELALDFDQVVDLQQRRV